MSGKAKEYGKLAAIILALLTAWLASQTEYVASMDATTKVIIFGFLCFLAVAHEFQKLSNRVEELEFEVLDLKDVLSRHGLNNDYAYDQPSL